MAFGIPTVLGYHGNEIRFFDELWGGQGEWKNAGNPGLWNLYAVNYVVLPADGRTPDSIPGYRKTVAAAATTAGVQANLFERIDPFPYARVVSAAVKLPDDQAIKSLTAGRQFQDQVVLLNPSSTLATDSLAALPPPSATRATVTHWEPGRMQIPLDPAPAAPSYLVVGENYYPDWQATVDGTPGRVDRGDVALITVPVSAGARSVELTFRSADYERGEDDFARFHRFAPGLAQRGVVEAEGRTWLSGRSSSSRPTTSGRTSPRSSRRPRAGSPARGAGGGRRLARRHRRAGRRDGAGRTRACTCLHRPGKKGLGTAYVAGFRWALEHGFDYVFEMDADFSHDPSHLPRFLDADPTTPTW